MHPSLTGLPHRDPFRFVDEVLAIEPGLSAVGQKTFAASEPFFAGHFPGNPIVPGVILTEALAQLSGVVAAAGSPGETYLLSGRRSLVRARARTAVRALRVERERFHSVIENDGELSELLMRAFILRRVWLFSSGYGDAILVGSRFSPATLELQAFLARNAHPYRYVDVDREPDVQATLDHFHVGIADIPVLVCRG